MGAKVAVLAGVALVAGVAGGALWSPRSEGQSSGSTTTLSSTTAVIEGDTEPAGTGDAFVHRHGEDDAPPLFADRPTIVDFSGAERTKLAEQLQVAREVAIQLPTRADAEAAGFEPTTPYAPGTGSHMGRDDNTQAPDAALDVRKPQSYLYDGNDPDSRVVGLMYVQLGGETAPEGFAGPLDTWQKVDGQCLRADSFDPLYPTKSSVTKQECDAGGGRFLDIIAWIQHAWVVPGWEAPGGVFSAYNDDIVCADGSRESDNDSDGCQPPSGSPT